MNDEPSERRESASPPNVETTISPTHGHRIDASLSAATTVWQYMLEYLVDDPTKHVETESLLHQVARDIGQPSKKQLKTFSQLFHIEPSNLRLVTEVFNPNRFGPRTKRHGLNQGQVFDISLGDNLLDPRAQHSVLSHIRHERPGLTVISPPCGPFSALQNLSKSLRDRDWNAARRYMSKLKEARKLLRFAALVCWECHRLGLTFLFEQPRTARSWLEQPIRQLLRDPDIELVHGDQCMMGLRFITSGHAVKKPTSFLGNNPTVLKALEVKCDGSHIHEEVLGSDSRGPRSRQAQEYPQGLVDRVLRAYAASCHLATHDIHFQVAADVIQEDDRISQNYFTEEERYQILAADEPPAMRDLPDLPVAPSLGVRANEFTQLCQDHLPAGQWQFWTRTDLQSSKLQLPGGDGPATPVIERRFTFDLATKQLIKMDVMTELDPESLELELEDTKDIVTVFAWQKSRELPGARVVTLERLVRRAHEGLGHPETNRFVRILKASGAKPEVLECAKRLKCSVCHQFQTPATKRNSAPPRENLHFNQLIGVDTIHLRDHHHRTVPALNMIDYASHFQLVVPMGSSTAKAARTAYRQWVKLFGVPTRVYGDLGGEFKSVFVQMLEEDGSEFVPSSLESPQQRGLVERAGQTYKNILYKTMNTVSCETDEAWKDAVDTTCMVRNRLLLRGGYSPIQRVLGYTPRLPGELMAGREPNLQNLELQKPSDLAVVRSMELRKAASKAFFDSDCQQSLQRAIYAGPRPWRHYEPGQVVYFFRRGADTQKKPLEFYWRGPARVLLVDMPNIIWLSFRNNIVKASPERIRPASEEETQTLSQWVEGLTTLREQLRQPQNKGIIDLPQLNSVKIRR